MNLAFVSSNLIFPWGGCEKPWTSAAEVAQGAGHHVLAVVTPLVAAHPRMQTLIAAGATLHARTRFSHRRAWGERLRAIFDRAARWDPLRAALAEFEPDCLLLNQGGVFDFLLEDQLLEWCRETRVPVVLYCHCNSEAWSVPASDRARAQAIFGEARATAFVSTHNLILAERQLGASIPRALVLQSPIEPRLLAEPPAWPADAPVAAAVVARLDAHHKGLDLLLSALPSAWSAQGDWSVNFYGDGPDRSHLEKLAAKSGISARVRFHGFVSDIRSVWAQNHLLLMPSRHEGCSLSMLEALACGRPVLATDVGGVSDWLVDGLNGFVCPAPTIPLLAETLRRAWDSRGNWRTLGVAAHRVSSERREAAPEEKLLHLMTREPVVHA